MARSKEFPYEEIVEIWCMRTKQNSIFEIAAELKRSKGEIYQIWNRDEISHLLGGFGGVFLLSFSPVGSYGSRNSWSASDSTKQQWQTTQREPLSGFSRSAISGITAAEFVGLELEVVPGPS
ncbi:hypothetical protein AVEN_156469-1 [Araneus ventricosus]|uniref:Uncharacterized protein n=1 Tax=Araneus ventricosus TaxID=182803 RepID=A0A4Y2SU42_ARAVE|nr:hypothetical protein AVEN_253676-1 [Araneus ventricosus]GBN90713.1 hypothetical protein AVEN_156469-1 [Araneus ventricosus]